MKISSGKHFVMLRLKLKLKLATVVYLLVNVGETPANQS